MIVLLQRGIFRRERLDEPLVQYTQFFDIFAPLFEELIDHIDDLSADDADSDLLVSIMQDKDKRTAFRYLTAPPISEDDLRTLAEASLSPSVLRRHPEMAKSVRETVLHVLDPKRFPWVTQDRPSSDSERLSAKVASAAMVAAQKVQTLRRNEAKDEQEQAVKNLLLSMGFTEGEREPIKNLLVNALSQANSILKLCWGRPELTW